MALCGRSEHSNMTFQAVLFDCDGVLVDSEPITNALLRDMLAERGWVMSSEECFRYFVGKAVKDHQAEIEARTGLPLTEEWLHCKLSLRFRWQTTWPWQLLSSKVNRHLAKWPRATSIGAQLPNA